MKTKSLVTVLLALAIVAVESPASAAQFDLTVVGNTVWVNGGGFSTLPIEGSGTGNFDPFLRLQSNVTEAGYNTDGLVEFDTKTGIWTHALPLSALQDSIVQIEGLNYYEFLLDINETGGRGSTISLNALEFWSFDSPTMTGYNSWPGSAMSWTLGENSVNLDSNNSTGSGTPDMWAWIPVSAFPEYDSETLQYVYLYSEFGNPFPTDDGFEEWALSVVDYVPPTVPDGGATLALLGGALLCLGVLRRKFRA